MIYDESDDQFFSRNNLYSTFIFLNFIKIGGYFYELCLVKSYMSLFYYSPCTRIVHNIEYRQGHPVRALCDA